jgi:hypothetical protein
MKTTEGNTLSGPPPPIKINKNRQERKYKMRKKQFFYSHRVQIFLCILGIGIYGR